MKKLKIIIETIVLVAIIVIAVVITILAINGKKDTIAPAAPTGLKIIITE